MRDILRGCASVPGYVLFLRNLLPAYQVLEDALARHQHRAGIRWVARPLVYRSEAIQADLHQLCGPAWDRRVPLIPAGEAYADAVRVAAAGDAARLIAHAYTRYLGDLNGGALLRKALSRSLALPPQALAFYEFPTIADRQAFAADYRQAIDRAGSEIRDVGPVIDEAAVAFRLNILLSTAVKGAQPASASATTGERQPSLRRTDTLDPPC